MTEYKAIKNSAIIFLIALLIRSIYSFFFVELEYLFTEDQMLYVELAQQFPKSGFWGVIPERVPGYPFFLSLIYTLFGEKIWNVIFIQILVDSFSCVITSQIAYLIFGRGFWVAGILSAVNLNMVILSSSLLTDTLFLFLFVLFLFSLLKYLHSEKTNWLFLLVLFLSLATLVRASSYYLLPILFGILVIWRLWRKDSFSKVLTMMLIYLLVSVTIIGSIHYRNYQQYGSTEFVSQTGRHMTGWIVPAVYQYSGQGSYQEGKKIAEERLKSSLKRDNSLVLSSNPFERSSYKANVAKEILLEFGFVKVLKAWTVGSIINLLAPSIAFSPALRSMDHPSFYNTKGDGMIDKIHNYVKDSSGFLYVLILTIGTLISIIFLLFAIIGAFKMTSKLPNIQVIVLILLLGYFLAITGPIIGVKYRLPIEPILILFVTYFLNIYFSKRRVKNLIK
jgi:hypothetical protein